MKEPTQTDAPSNSFMAVLQRKETQVGTLSEASDLLAAAVKAAGGPGKRATVTLTLTVEPKQGALHFETKLATRLPVVAQPLCIFYADRDGGLHRDDPRQKELALEVRSGGLSDEPAATQQEAATA